MTKFFMIVAYSLISTIGFSQILTVAESSNFESTSNEKEVNDFINKITKNSKIARFETMAVSPEGRNIPLLIIADPLPKSAKDIKNDKRVVFYIQANIHGGEVEGKEASLMFARDLITGKKKEILKNVIVLICPNFNADGNEKISPLNRTHQNGPKNGVGLRYNGQALDLNRDAMKLESPEMNGLLKNVLNTWDPHVMVDCHTTNGSYHEEPVTFAWMMNPSGDESLIDFMEKDLMPAVSSTLLKDYKVENCYYGEFIDMGKPELGWIEEAVEPRYIVNYMGIRNRLAILNENYVYADYKSRVLGCYGLLNSIANYAAQNGTKIKNLIQKADQNTIQRGLNPTDRDSFPIEFKAFPLSEKISIKTYEVERKSDTTGWDKYQKTDRKKTVLVPYIADYKATSSVKFPFAYLLTIQDPSVLDLLKRHGIKVGKLTKAQSFEVESFKIKDLSPKLRLNQGHYNNSIVGSVSNVKQEFKAGTYVIRTAQPLANLAAYLLEPLSDDGFVFWNVLDKHLVPQWGRGFFPYPVYKIMSKVEIEDIEVL